MKYLFLLLPFAAFSQAKKIQPIYIGVDTLNILAVSPSYTIDTKKKTFTVQYAITNKGQTNVVKNVVILQYIKNEILEGDKLVEAVFNHLKLN